MSHSRDTTAWFVPWSTSNSRGRTSTISTRSKVGPSSGTTSFTSTPGPASARSRESVRRPTRRGLAGGKSEPRARTMTGGKARRTTCQLRKARPATRSPRDAAARPLDSGVRMSRHLRHGDLTQDVREDRRSPYASDPGIRLPGDPMGERRHRDRLDVVRRDEVPSRDRGSRARHLQEGEGASWTRADIDLAVGPRRRDDVDHVPFDDGLDVDVFDRGLQGAHLVGRRHPLDRRVVRPAFSASLEDLDFLLSRRVAHVDLQQESIDLGFRQRIGALVLNRILRRNHEERPVERERFALQRRLPFLHRLEERGLGLRRGAVDLVREEDVREDRAPSEDEVAGLAVEHVGPRDVRGQQVRRELDATEREAQARRERFRDQRLRQPGDILDQEMTIAEDRPEDPFEDGALADDHGLDRVEEVAADLPDRRDVHRHASIRVRTSRNSRTKPRRARARWTHAIRSSRSPASRKRKSTSASSPNIRRRAPASRCTSRIISGGRPRASRARSRNADRARDATRTWLYGRPRAARRTAAANESSSPWRVAPGDRGPTSGDGSAVRRWIWPQAIAASTASATTPRSHPIEPLGRGALELPRSEGARGGDPARAEQREEPPETREDHGPDVPADLQFLDRVLHRVGRGVPGRGIVVQGLRFDLDDARAAAEQDDQDDDRDEDSEAEEQAERRAGGDRPSGPARGPRVPGRRSGLADPERLEHPGPGEQQGDDQDQSDHGGDDLPPRERFRRSPPPDPAAQERVDEDRDYETHEDDEEQVSQERVEDAERARFRPARGAAPRDRLASGVEVRDVEGERRDEQDRQEQEQRDRPLGLPPPRADHVCAKAPCAHNGFPDSRGSREVTRR